MTDHLTPEGRSRVMSAIRSKNTKPELAMRAGLRQAGATGYRLHVRDLPGKPDVAFTRWKVAVFVDGAFWHGHPDRFNAEAATSYWREKIKRTQARDTLADQKLRDSGWHVLRIWDFRIKSDLEECVSEVLCELKSAGWARKPPTVVG